MDNEYYRDEQEQERRRLIRMELKRKQLRQQRIALGAVCVAVVLLLVMMIRGCSDKQKEVQKQNDLKEATSNLQNEVKDITATIAAVGDIMCYDDQIKAALQEDGSYDFSASFAAIKPYIENANLAVGNLELNFLGESAGYSGYPNFNAPEALADDLKEIGFDLLQTANTYSIQNGINGLNSTIKYLTASGIDHIGTYHNKEAKTEDQGVILKNINGIRFAFLAYTKGLNNMALPQDASYAANVLFEDYATNYSVINKKSLLASVQAAKDMKADVIVAMLHWGNEYKIEPFSSQNEIANLLFQNGVDVILGSHSHEVGPMEMRTVQVDGKSKDVFIAYSLGNFFSSMDKGTSRTSAVLNLTFTMDAETGEVRISAADYLPIYIVDKGENATTRFEVLPVRTAMESSVFSYMNDTFTKALTTLEKNTKSTFDSGK